MSKVSQEVIDLSEKISAGVAHADGKITIDANTYVQTLPPEVSVEAANALHKHNSNFFPAATRAIGLKANEIFKSDKKAEKFVVEVPMIGKDHFDVTVERSHTFPIPGGGESTTWGSISAKLTVQSARAARGAMSAVRDELSAAALAAYGK